MDWKTIFLCLVLAIMGCSKSPQQQVLEHKARADEYLKGGKLDEAVLEFRAALQIDPNDKDSLFKAGDIYIQKQQFNEAYQCFKKISEIAPNNYDAQVRIGNIYLLANSLSEARKRAQIVIAGAPNRGDAHMLLGKVYLREQKFSEGFAEVDRAIELAPANSGYRLFKATSLIATRRFDDARRILEDVLAKDQANGAALVLLAQAADLQNDRAKVEETFARLLKAKPEGPVTWMNFGNFWLSKGESAKAIEAYEKAGEFEGQGTMGWERVAEVSLQRGDLKKARKAVSEIYGRNKKSSAGRFYEARILLDEGKIGDAEALLVEYAKQYPNKSEAHYYLALTRYANGNLEGTKAELQKALQLNPKYYDAGVLLARAFVGTRDFDQALKATDHLIQGRSMRPDAAVVRAEALMGQGRVVEARKMLERVVKEVPRHALAQERLGQCYLAENKKTEALRAFDRALEGNPKSLVPLAYASQILVSQKRIDEAIAKVEGQMRTVGESAGARELLGNLYRAKGDRGRARAELERAIQLDPNAIGSYVGLAAMEPWPAGVQKAIADLDRGLAKRPDSVQAWMMKGLLLAASGRPSDSEKSYRKAVELNPAFVPALNELAWNLAENGGNIDEALKFAGKAVELAPSSPIVNDTLGWIYVKKGVFLKATSHLEPAAQALRGNPEVQYHLGKAYAGLGENKKAVASLRKALGLSKKFSGAGDAEKMLRELEGKKG